MRVLSSSSPRHLTDARLTRSMDAPNRAPRWIVTGVLGLAVLGTAGCASSPPVRERAARPRRGGRRARGVDLVATADHEGLAAGQRRYLSGGRPGWRQEGDRALAADREQPDHAAVRSHAVM